MLTTKVPTGKEVETSFENNCATRYRPTLPINPPIATKIIVLLIKNTISKFYSRVKSKDKFYNGEHEGLF